VTIETLKTEYTTLSTKALAICDTAAKEQRSLTDDEQTKFADLVEQAQTKHGEIEKQKASGFMSLDELERLLDPINAGTKTHGSRETHPWTKALTNATHLVGGHGEKAGVTGGGQGAVMVGSLADPAARLGTPGGEILSLITIEPWGTRGDGSAVNFLREATRSLAAAAVPVGTAKPPSDGLEMVTADATTYAHTIPGVPIQWLADAANWTR
jgi:hypothetical protein